MKTRRLKTPDLPSHAYSDQTCHQFRSKVGHPFAFKRCHLFCSKLSQEVRFKVGHALQC